MSTVQTFFKQIITEYLETNLSDIYFVPLASGEYQLMIRTSTKVIKKNILSTAMGSQLITYLKFLANLDVTERRRPQTGHFTLSDFEQINFRISTVGDYQQRETLVCRFIYESHALEPSYFFPEQFNRLIKRTEQPGLHILAGPMGSGKTTTMYGLAQALVERNKIVLTIEDPVEINNPNLIQLQVNDTANMTYANLIKSGLRHRPDVFVIGEIRDTQTAQATIHAALSGHTVLTTIHALSADNVNMRLLEMGVNRAYLSASLQSITYQRLLPDLKSNLRALQVQIYGHDIWENTGEKWHEKLVEALAANKITTTTFANFKTLDA
ncbi:competence type IV pilus ATPase ComGA [Periweissella fabalis]|uniref:Flp pilus assembly complex ATPase component TadA n=1 Tax=Periweissella fabalis TaxID=1070421 RepID=A0A7X6N1V0_9LACO|nr:competence type IV pilus ATPase ComGA [Periweissella fabalis]MCM0598494.1 Flp pilus assembly complex ATPase component TadA [Periweissella fabalis]NKZ24226.1 Flp pilus assembly complex ATPase component TadA [Periweissella fabalis]